jgi:hypothetical protein
MRWRCGRAGRRRGEILLFLKKKKQKDFYSWRCPEIRVERHADPRNWVGERRGHKSLLRIFL